MPCDRRLLLKKKHPEINCAQAARQRAQRRRQLDSNLYNARKTETSYLENDVLPARTYCTSLMQMQQQPKWHIFANSVEQIIKAMRQ